MANFNFEYMGDYLQYKDSQGNTLIVNGGIINETATGAVAEFTDGAENIPVKSLTVTMNPIQSGTGDPSPDNVRHISGRTTANIWREATYETSAEPTITIQLGQTVYGGTVDVISGVMTVDRAIVDLGDVSWSKDAEHTGQFFRAMTNTEFLQFPKYSGINMCSAYKCVQNKSYILIGNCEITIGNSPVMPILRVKDDAYDAYTANQFKSAMSGIQFCYELAQPITVQLTPEQLTTLLGTNYIWSDADSVSVDYVADTKLYIQNAISDSV